MKKEIRDMDQKDTPTTWKIITCMKKRKHEKQCIPLPTRRERGQLTKLL